MGGGNINPFIGNKYIVLKPLSTKGIVNGRELNLTLDVDDIIHIVKKDDVTNEYIVEFINEEGQKYSNIRIPDVLIPTEQNNSKVFAFFKKYNEGNILSGRPSSPWKENINLNPWAGGKRHRKTRRRVKRSKVTKRKVRR